MLLVYSPDNAERQTLPFQPDKLTSAEAETLERLTGWTYAEFTTKLLQGSARARRLLLWVLQKRTHPTLKEADVQPLVGEVTIEFEPAEIDDFRAQVEAATNIDETDRAEALAALDLMSAADEAAEPAPKAPSRNAGNG